MLFRGRRKLESPDEAHSDKKNTWNATQTVTCDQDWTQGLWSCQVGTLPANHFYTHPDTTQTLIILYNSMRENMSVCVTRSKQDWLQSSANFSICEAKQHEIQNFSNAGFAFSKHSIHSVGISCQGRVKCRAALKCPSKEKKTPTTTTTEKNSEHLRLVWSRSRSGGCWARGRGRLSSERKQSGTLKEGETWE